MSRWVLCLALTAIVGCSGSHGPAPDAGDEDAPGQVRRCEDVAFAPDGTACRFEGECREESGCCTSTWTCDEGALRSERTCVPECFRSCDDALARGAQGDPCEGAYFCSSFSDDLCCTHAVECAGGRLDVEDSCTPGCP
jgi:hypothetical protein